MKRRKARLEAQKIENLIDVLTIIGGITEFVKDSGRKLIERAIVWKIMFAIVKSEIIFRAVGFEENLTYLQRSNKHARIEIT